MQLTLDLPDDLAAFAQQSADLLEYDRVDDFIAALLERQRETLGRSATSGRSHGGVTWHPSLHDPLRRQIDAARKTSVPA